VPDHVGVDASSEMAAFAAVTGGVSFNASTGLDRRLERVRDDLENYYSLGFRAPSRSNRKGSNLEVQVRVRRPDVRVRHRTSIRVRSDDETASDATLAALLTQGEPANPWKLHIEIGAIRPARGRGRLARITIHIPLANVRFVETAGKRSARLSLHFAMRDASGNYQILDSRNLPLEIEKTREISGNTIEYHVDLPIRADANDLAVTVFDRHGSAYSTVRRSVGSPRG
ncbi:MAG TPA: hypothetical protein VMS98_03465, partial [Thermoanaerobaculia bacterium]|nr:hypothetical protein [Thermoanaerobaculia bacterium]